MTLALSDRSRGVGDAAEVGPQGDGPRRPPRTLGAIDRTGSDVLAALASELRRAIFPNGVHALTTLSYFEAFESIALQVTRLAPGGLTLMDWKTGVMNLEIRQRRQPYLDRKEKLPADLEALLQTKQITVPWQADHDWHDLVLVTEGDEMRLSLDGKLVAAHRSPGFAHPLKRWFSLLVASTVWIDDVTLWKVK